MALFPAAARLGLPEPGTPSPAVQDIAALTGSQLPAPEARQGVARLTGRKLSAAPWPGPPGGKASAPRPNARAAPRQ